MECLTNLHVNFAQGAMLIFSLLFNFNFYAAKVSTVIFLFKVKFIKLIPLFHKFKINFDMKSIICIFHYIYIINPQV